MGIKYHHLPREPWPANIPKKLSKNEKGWHPHNFILEMMCEYGLVGGVIILVPLGIFILCAMRAVFSVHTDISHIQSTAIAPAILFTTARLFTGSLAEIWPLVFVLFACMPLSAEQSRRLMRGSLQEADPVSPTEPPTPQSVQVRQRLMNPQIRVTTTSSSSQHGHTVVNTVDARRAFTVSRRGLTQ